MSLINKGANKRKLTIQVGNALYNISKPQLQKLALRGMSNDGVTGADVEAMGATKLSAPVPDADVTSWDAAQWQAALTESLGQ